MQQMLLELLSKERRVGRPDVITAHFGKDSITIEAPEKNPVTVSPAQAGELLAHDIISLLSEKATPDVKSPPVISCAWLCLANDGLKNPSVGTVLEAAELTLAHEWASRAPRRPRAKSLKSIRRTNPPAFVILSREETPTSDVVAYRVAEAFVRHQMTSPYATSIVKILKDNPAWLRDEKQRNPHALRRLEKLVVRDVSEGNLQSHAVLIFDDEKPQPLEETVDVALAMTCMSEETQRHPALQGSHNNLFTVVVEKPEPAE